MIKVLMVGNHPSNKGGMTSVISQILEHDWSADGVEISFVPTFLPGNAAKKILFFAISYIRILCRMIFSKPDIVHMHMSYKGSFMRKYRIHKLCRLFNVKDIIHLHGSEFGKWYSTLSESSQKKVRELLTECNSLIVLGEEWKKIILSIEPSANVTVISNGIKIPEKTVKWNDKKCQVLFLGVLIPRKGVSDLINAVSLLKEQGQTEDLSFVIAGTGDEEERLKKMVSDASLGETVSFAGWVTGDKKTELIENSQIMVSPSYNEGLPISLLEAASYGMPVVSTDVGDISSVVTDQVSGILITPGDVEALADGIRTVASEPVFIRMSAKIRETAEEKFSINSFYTKLSELYHFVGETNE